MVAKVEAEILKGTVNKVQKNRLAPHPVSVMLPYGRLITNNSGQEKLGRFVQHFPFCVETGAHFLGGLHETHLLA